MPISTTLHFSRVQCQQFAYTCRTSFTIPYILLSFPTTCNLFPCLLMVMHSAECQQRRRVTVSAKSRNRITLKCGLAGFRLRAVQWFLPNGKAVEALLSSQPSSIGATPYGNDKLELLRNGNLRINSLDPSDSGPYLCRLRPHVKLGAEAAITCTIRDLKVTGKPPCLELCSC